MLPTRVLEVVLRAMEHFEGAGIVHKIEVWMEGKEDLDGRIALLNGRHLDEFVE